MLAEYRCKVSTGSMFVYQKTYLSDRHINVLCEHELWECQSRFYKPKPRSTSIGIKNEMMNKYAPGRVNNWFNLSSAVIRVFFSGLSVAVRHCRTSEAVIVERSREELGFLCSRRHVTWVHVTRFFRTLWPWRDNCFDRHTILTPLQETSKDGGWIQFSD